MFTDIVKKELFQARDVLDNFIQEEKNLALIDQAVHLIVNCFNNKGKIFSCGNGGSQCDAMHFAEELTGRFRNNRQAFPAIAISDSSHISCVSNDYGYDYIFSRYLEGLAVEGDILLAISTSGKSTNILKAIEQAKKQKMKIIALTGKDGGKIATNVDLEIRVPYFGYADRIQEMHIKIIHCLILGVEYFLCN